MLAKPIYWLINLRDAVKRKLLKKAHSRSVIDQFMRSPKSFKHVINNLAGNPEALYALLSHPKIKKAISPQAHFLSALAASSETVNNILKFASPEARAAAIRSIALESETSLRGLSANPFWVQAYLGIRQQKNVAKTDADEFIYQKFVDSLVELAGENPTQLLSHMLSRHPALVQRALTDGELRDHVIYAASRDRTLCAQILAFAVLNPSLGASKRERLANTLQAALLHPLIFNAAAADKKFVPEILLALSDLAELTGNALPGHATKPALPAPAAGAVTSIATLIDTVPDDAVAKFAATAASLETIKKLEGLLAEIGKKRGRLGLKDESRSALLDYVSALIRDDQIPMKMGGLQVADPAGFATTAEEILVKEEYFCDIGPAPFIIDCGANIGLSLFYFKSAFPNSTILAFEPVPGLYQIATANIEAFRFSGITLRQQAIAPQSGILELQVDETNSLAASLTHRRAARGGNLSAINVEAIALGDVIDRPVDLLKMDIEGVEYDVILSLGDKVRQVHYLFCEFHADDEIARRKMAQLLLFLGEQGFSYQIARTAWAEHAYSKRPLTFAQKPLSYGIYAVNTRWADRG